MTLIQGERSHIVRRCFSCSHQYVATALFLLLLQDLHVDSLLNGLVLGESLLNDAVAIILCSSIEEYAKVSLTAGAAFEVEALVSTVVKFFSIMFGSVGLGGERGPGTREAEAANRRRLLY